MTQGTRTLGGRYTIEGLLGEGGMATVYRGTDKVLGRTVAIKVLSPRFANDKSFVERFRREAQAAAALNHPNLVGVYDTGSDRGTHYIVMELVEGRTLRDLIQEEGPILPERAAEIASAVASALGFAHARGIVHRDIKPANIMITPDGEVKVMDFGIARASTGGDLTQTATILGTATYLSPEQAQGEKGDGRSDLYSLGVVLYEMLTRQPPFTGESPVSVAYKHAREEAVRPSLLNPDVPPPLESIVMKALAKNPANRYQSAEEMQGDLERFLAGSPVHATPLLPPDLTEVVTRDARPTAILSAPEGPAEGRGGRTLAIVLIALLILGALVAGGFFLLKNIEGGKAQVAVPTVVGKNVDVAIQILETRGLKGHVDRQVFDESQPEGTVLSQDPPARAQIDEGSTVELVISRGAKPVKVPDLTGKTAQEAQDILSAQGLGQVLATDRENPDVEKGKIFDQDPPPGERVAPGTNVIVVVSSGAPTVTVPNLRGLTESEAKNALEAEGLTLGNVTEEVCVSPNGTGTVCSQDPPKNSVVAAGSPVDIVLMLEPVPSPPVSPSPSPT